MKEFFAYLLLRLKYVIARDEMEALERYRLICTETIRFNAGVPQSAMTAVHINDYGENRCGLDSWKFRNYINGLLPNDPAYNNALYVATWPQGKTTGDKQKRHE